MGVATNNVERLSAGQTQEATRCTGGWSNKVSLRGSSCFAQTAIAQGESMAKYPQEDGNSSSKASPKSLEQFQTTRRRFPRSTSKRTPHPTTECMSPGASRHGQNVHISFGNFNSLHSGEEVAFSLVFNVGSLKGEREEERDEGGGLRQVYHRHGFQSRYVAV